MSKYVWKKVRGIWSCEPGGHGKPCYKRSFFLPQDEVDDQLTELTERVNGVVEEYADLRPGMELRILADTDPDEHPDQLRFAFVEAVPEDGSDPG
jgi:hypothetical protein